MKDKYIKEDPWSIIQEGWNPKRVKSSESLFSIGNGFFGQRANFEETYTGDAFQGSYIGGVYYPDKTRVGWWKNGYPEYFAKVLNAPNWIGIRVISDGKEVDLHTATKIENYRLELNMQEGWLERSFTIYLADDNILDIRSTRFISLEVNEVGAIKYSITSKAKDCKLTLIPYVDAEVSNHDSNWDDAFWSFHGSESYDNKAIVLTSTNKTNFDVATMMCAEIHLNDETLTTPTKINKTDTKVEHVYDVRVFKDNPVTLIKYGGYVSSFHQEKNNINTYAKSILDKCESIGYHSLLESQKKRWADIWEISDIEIEGDISAQQGIRYNIFQLNQTYNGEDARLNIGPKGFTGEKYGGSTYWDTEAYCLPFYMATKDQEVALNLLKYRHNQLPQAIENAAKLGFSDGAALYPMVTMNGEECHNEWEITFEEIHRNAAIAYAIYNYTRYTNDSSYLHNQGIEVLLAIARFWVQRSQYSQDKKQWVILGVTGPNEYENNINNNWYTNYMTRWCMTYTLGTLSTIKSENLFRFIKLQKELAWTDDEAERMKAVTSNMYLPYSEEHQVFLQQDGFLDKELSPVDALDPSQRPINQHWSWDRILRSCYIKQADTLQGFYFMPDDFSKEELERHFDFYEPMTVHESSLSPCIHSILACRIDRLDKAYDLYLRTSRLDLDDYNHEVDEGCHITSMAGTWLSIVEGFGGMMIKDGLLHLNPQIPKQWSSYNFKIRYRGQVLKISISKTNAEAYNYTNTFVELIKGNTPVEVVLFGKKITVGSTSSNQ